MLEIEFLLPLVLSNSYYHRNSPEFHIQNKYIYRQAWQVWWVLCKNKQTQKLNIKDQNSTRTWYTTGIYLVCILKTLDLQLVTWNFGFPQQFVV